MWIIVRKKEWAYAFIKNEKGRKLKPWFSGDSEGEDPAVYAILYIFGTVPKLLVPPGPLQMSNIWMTRLQMRAQTMSEGSSVSFGLCRSCLTTKQRDSEAMIFGGTLRLIGVQRMPAVIDNVLLSRCSVNETCLLDIGQPCGPLRSTTTIEPMTRFRHGFCLHNTIWYPRAPPSYKRIHHDLFKLSKTCIYGLVSCLVFIPQYCCYISQILKFFPNGLDMVGTMFPSLRRPQYTC